MDAAEEEEEEEVVEGDLRTRALEEPPATDTVTGEPPRDEDEDEEEAEKAVEPADLALFGPSLITSFLDEPEEVGPTAEGVDTEDMAVLAGGEPRPEGCETDSAGVAAARESAGETKPALPALLMLWLFAAWPRRPDPLPFPDPIWGGGLQFLHPTQRQCSEHSTPTRKHSQYFLRQPVFLQ